MVYLICFERPFGHAHHYIGYSDDSRFAARIECHRKGRGSRLLRAVNEAGINWKVVRTWPGKDGNFERKLKNRKKAWQLCPVCHQMMLERMKEGNNHGKQLLLQLCQ